MRVLRGRAGRRTRGFHDERHDLERATYAAASYLKDLRVRFGSWELALAAFNAGYGLVMTSVSRSNTNNFWALCEMESGLPHATTMYVPKIIAAAIVGRNRAAFHVGPDLSGSLPPIQIATVEAPPATSLASVASSVARRSGAIARGEEHARARGGRGAARAPRRSPTRRSDADRGCCTGPGRRSGPRSHVDAARRRRAAGPTGRARRR